MHAVSLCIKRAPNSNFLYGQRFHTSCVFLYWVTNICRRIKI